MRRRSLKEIIKRIAARYAEIAPLITETRISPARRLRWAAEARAIAEVMYWFTRDSRWYEIEEKLAKHIIGLLKSLEQTQPVYAARGTRRNKRPKLATFF